MWKVILPHFYLGHFVSTLINCTSENWRCYGKTILFIILQKRRKNMSSQKKRRELEKQRRRYHSKKPVREQTKPVKRRLPLCKTLFAVKEKLKGLRSKFDLWKRQFAINLLNKKSVLDQKDISEYYQRNRPLVNSFVVQNFLEKVAIDLPCKKGASEQKKVLTKPMHILLKDFQQAHPGMKMSLTTFKGDDQDTFYCLPVENLNNACVKSVKTHLTYA